MNPATPEAAAATPRAKLLKRLRPYYQMEAANVILVPIIACVAVLADPAGRITPAMVAAMAATSFLLIVGTIAWKMVVDGLEGKRETERQWVPRLAAARAPSIALILIALALTTWEAMQSLPNWPGSLIAAVLLVVLAILEYVNYYHYQLQHFDHAADFARLMSGRGFRRSHLSRAISAWEAREKGQSS